MRELKTQVIAENFEGWSSELHEEFERSQNNFEVGTELLSETEELKVWMIHVAPGERVGVHRHVLDYFWVATTDGVAVQHEDNGITRRTQYEVGMTAHLTFGEGEYLLHDLNNVGDDVLSFVTVEHKR